MACGLDLACGGTLSGLWGVLLGPVGPWCGGLGQLVVVGAPAELPLLKLLLAPASSMPTHGPIPHREV